MFYFLERSIAVLKPKQAFLDWINQTFEELPQPLTLESIRIDCNAYIIPEVEEIEDGINYIDSKFEELFALELTSWTEDENLWPQDRTLKLFWEWIEVEIHPTIIDIEEDEKGEQTQKNEEETIH